MRTKAAVILFMLALVIAVSARDAFAEFTASVELRETYEDNVIGLVADNPNIAGITGGGGDRHGGRGGSGSGTSGSGRLAKGLDDNPAAVTTGTTGTAAGGGATTVKGDFSTSISVDVGASFDMGNRISLLVKADVDHTAYRTYDQFDFTIGSVGAGAGMKFTDEISGRLMLRGSMKSFQNSLRNSTAYGISASLKEQLTDAFMLRQFYDYEQNDADSSLYSYVGQSVGIWAGYTFFDKLTFGAGYSYLLRSFKEPSTFEVTSKTVSTDLTWEIGGGWSMNIGYDREEGDSTVPDSLTINNIYSAGLMYRY